MEYTEEIEADMVIHLYVNGVKLSAVEKMGDEQAPRYNPGQTVHITIDGDYLHIFDKDGNRV